MTRVDTNYIVRYLVNDDKKMANIAENLLTSKDVYIANEVIAEVVYVLHGVYKISKIDISNRLLQLVCFDNISVSNLQIIKQTFKIYQTENLDFVDSLLCAYSTIDDIATFDKKLNKCIQGR